MLILAGAGFLYWHFVLKTNVMETRRLMIQSENLAEKINELDLKIQKGVQKEKEWEEKWGPLQDELAGAFPEVKDLPLVMDQFHSLIEKHGLAIENLRVNEFTGDLEMGECPFLPLSVEVKGEYGTMLNFLDDLENLPYTTIIEELIIDRSKDLLNIYLSFAFRQ